jgi:uncharacterized membrane protein
MFEKVVLGGIEKRVRMESLDSEPRMKVQPRLVLILLLGVLGLGVVFFGLERRPGYFASSTYLGAILALEVVLACLWKFEKVFFPVTLGCFVLTGTSLPFAGESFTIRWLFLAVALFCVLSGLASASSSSVPVTAALKVASLFLLFCTPQPGRGRHWRGGRSLLFADWF